MQYLSVKKIEFIGNLKLSNKNFGINNSNFNDEINNSIMFASTHLGEEEQILPVVNKLVIKNPNLRFFIAPRHPERSYLIQKYFQKNNLFNLIKVI